MATLSRFWVSHTTADQEDAETDAGFQVQVGLPGTDFLAPFEDLPHDEREKGRTDQYTFKIPDDEPIDTDDIGNIVMRMTTSENGGLPSSMWVIGETIEAESGVLGYTILGAHPEWGGGWFDRGDDAAGPDHHLISS